MIMPDKKKVIEILIIIMGGIYLLYRIFMPKPDMKQAHDAAGHMPIGIEIAGLKETVKNPTEGDRKLKDEVAGARDIFQKPDEFFASSAKNEADAASKTGNSVLSLEGTIWGRGKNIAILSGAVVSEGDIIQKGKIVRIESDRVIIFKDGVESEIKRGT